MGEEEAQGSLLKGGAPQVQAWAAAGGLVLRVQAWVVVEVRVLLRGALTATSREAAQASAVAVPNQDQDAASLGVLVRGLEEQEYQRGVRKLQEVSALLPSPFVVDRQRAHPDS